MNSKKHLLSVLALSALLFGGCSDDDVPEVENEEEVIDYVSLTFTPSDGGTTIVATGTDPDGEGSADFVLEEINLKVNTTYELSIGIRNTVEDEDIAAEVAEEDDEHMLFFSFTEDIFSNPAGDGNIDNRADAVVYNDEDDNGNPVGLSTTWTTSDASTGGSLRIVLKHQPDIKSDTSGSTDGSSDIDNSWTINISE